MSFPADRYLRAGATPRQVAEQAAQFDLLSDAAQQSQLDRLAAISDYDIAEELAALEDAAPRLQYSDGSSH